MLDKVEQLIISSTGHGIDTARLQSIRRGLTLRLREFAAGRLQAFVRQRAKIGPLLKAKYNLLGRFSFPNDGVDLNHADTVMKRQSVQLCGHSSRNLNGLLELRWPIR